MNWCEAVKIRTQSCQKPIQAETSHSLGTRLSLVGAMIDHTMFRKLSHRDQHGVGTVDDFIGRTLGVHVHPVLHNACQITSADARHVALCIPTLLGKDHNTCVGIWPAAKCRIRRLNAEGYVDMLQIQANCMSIIIFRGRLHASSKFEHQPFICHANDQTLIAMQSSGVQRHIFPSSDAAEKIQV